MDFEVFLVSQIKEHADAGEDRKCSVVSGLLNNGRVITAAATIMVFGSFVLDAPRTVKPFGIGLAVILDATVVRCLSCRPARPVWARPTGTCPAGSARSFPASASSARST